jgi:hypothetical protein
MHTTTGACCFSQACATLSKVSLVGFRFSSSFFSFFCERGRAESLICVQKKKKKKGGWGWRVMVVGVTSDIIKKNQQKKTLCLNVCA